MLTFWFSERVRPQWFDAASALDTEIREGFRATWRAAIAGRLTAWEETPAGALALTIVLDQFPLNMFRGTAQAFAGESAARAVAARAIERGFDAGLEDAGKAFLYLPYMHSERMADQERSVALFEAAGLKSNLKWACHHREVVRRFGRFPHRNAVLGRASTPEEVVWLESPEGYHPA